jgi:hypothetical protein
MKTSTKTAVRKAAAKKTADEETTVPATNEAEAAEQQATTTTRAGRSRDRAARAKVQAALDRFAQGTDTEEDLNTTMRDQGLMRCATMHQACAFISACDDRRNRGLPIPPAALLEWANLLRIRCEQSPSKLKNTAPPPTLPNGRPTFRTPKFA